MAIMFAVPKGTPPAVCSAPTCRRVIYWILTGSGKRMPINVNVPDGKPPTKLLPGQGLPHWADCPEAGTFRKARANG